MEGNSLLHRKVIKSSSGPEVLREKGMEMANQIDACFDSLISGAAVWRWINNQVEKKAGNRNLVTYVLLGAVEGAETPPKLSWLLWK